MEDVEFIDSPTDNRYILSVRQSDLFEITYAIDVMPTADDDLPPLFDYYFDVHLFIIIRSATAIIILTLTRIRDTFDNLRAMAYSAVTICQCDLAIG